MSEVFLEKCFFLAFFAAPRFSAGIRFPSFENHTVAVELPAKLRANRSFFQKCAQLEHFFARPICSWCEQNRSRAPLMRIKWAQMSTRNENCETYSSAAPVLAAGVIACRTAK